MTARSTARRRRRVRQPRPGRPRDCREPPGRCPDPLGHARAAAADRRFGAALDAYRRAGPVDTLSADDRLAWSGAAWWLGQSDEALRLAELGHRRLTSRAVQEAIGLGFLLMLRGDLERAVERARVARDVARRAGDQALLAMALMTEGTASLGTGAVVRRTRPPSSTESPGRSPRTGCSSWWTYAPPATPTRTSACREPPSCKGSRCCTA